MGDHEHACLRNGTNQNLSPLQHTRCAALAESDRHGQPTSVWCGPRRLKCNGTHCTLECDRMMPLGAACIPNSLSSQCIPLMCQPLSQERSGIGGVYGQVGRVSSRGKEGCHSVRGVYLWGPSFWDQAFGPPVDSFSNQTRLPAELKHITKRRKRN